MPDTVRRHAPTPERRPATADFVLLGAAAVYAAGNVIVMLSFAANQLGPVPFGLIYALLAVNAVATVAAFPAWVALRGFGVTTWFAVGATALFGGLTLFNWWCLGAAAAAV